VHAQGVVHVFDSFECAIRECPNNGVTGRDG
jgi:hypothetical protein